MAASLFHFRSTMTVLASSTNLPNSLGGASTPHPLLTTRLVVVTSSNIAHGYQIELHKVESNDHLGQLGNHGRNVSRCQSARKYELLFGQLEMAIRKSK